MSDEIEESTSLVPELLDAAAFKREDQEIGPKLELIPSDLTTREVRPQTVLVALMMQAPGDPLQESVEEVSGLHEAIAYASDCVTDEDLYILNAINAEGIGFDGLAARLSVSRTQGWRLHKRSITRLRALLLSHAPVRERLGMPPTWNSAAMAELVTISGFDEGWPEDQGPYTMSAAALDIVGAIEVAVRQLDAGVEKYAVDSLTEAGRSAVLYLRSVGKWRLLDMHTLLCSKQADYGHGNILKFGMVGVMVRASDKGERLKNLVTLGGTVAPRNETLLDTFFDVVGYAVIARMLKAESFELELDGSA